MVRLHRTMIVITPKHVFHYLTDNSVILYLNINQNCCKTPRAAQVDTRAARRRGASGARACTVHCALCTVRGVYCVLCAVCTVHRAWRVLCTVRGVYCVLCVVRGVYCARPSRASGTAHDLVNYVRNVDSFHFCKKSIVRADEMW